MASRVFEDENVLIIPDEKHSIYEERYTAIGEVDKILYVVYTEQMNATRIISARAATPKERRMYYAGI